MKSKSNEPVLLLTGCINPNGMNFTSIQSAEIRLQHYLGAINFYLQQTSLKILFVENSGYDISNHLLPFIDQGRLEILTFDGNDYDKSLGKGYGEMLIIAHALEHSTFVKNATFVFKITGRHKILNINTFINQYYSTPGIEIFADLLGKLSFADSKFFGATVDFYKFFLPKLTIINDSKNITFEDALGQAIHEAIAAGYKFSFFNSFPRCSGVSGTTSKKYDDSWLTWFKSNLKYKLIHQLMG
jgi:hypothetical protein